MLDSLQGAVNESAAAARGAETQHAQQIPGASAEPWRPWGLRSRLEGGSAPHSPSFQPPREVRVRFGHRMRARVLLLLALVALSASGARAQGNLLSNAASSLQAAKQQAVAGMQAALAPLAQSLSALGCVACCCCALLLRLAPGLPCIGLPCQRRRCPASPPSTPHTPLQGGPGRELRHPEPAGGGHPGQAGERALHPRHLHQGLQEARQVCGAQLLAGDQHRLLLLQRDRALP